MRRSIELNLLRPYLTLEDLDVSLRQLVQSMLNGPATRANASRIAEKTPENCLYYLDLLDLFPDAVAIHVVRDARAVLASMLRVRARYVAEASEVPENIRTVEVMIETIRSHLVAGVLAAEREPERILLLRFEDLVRDPETTCRQLCKRTDLEYDKAMLSPDAQQHDAEYLVQLGSPWYSMSEYRRGIESARLDGRQHELDLRELNALASGFRGDRDLLGALGYIF